MFSFVVNLKLFIMEAKELRIGNYVNHKELGYVQVYGMNLEVIQFDYRKEPYYDEIPFKKLSYVPLTEEILLKCGFKITGQTEHPNNIWTVYGEECKFELEHITSFYLYDNKCFGTKVQYLHQLQNLYFALTNEELTVNL